jgi:hypothetical protein
LKALPGLGMLNRALDAMLLTVSMASTRAINGQYVGADRAGTA